MYGYALVDAETLRALSTLRHGPPREKDLTRRFSRDSNDGKIAVTLRRDRSHRFKSRARRANPQGQEQVTALFSSSEARNEFPACIMIFLTSPARKLTAQSMPTRRMTAAVPSLPLPPLQGYLFALLMLVVAWLLSFASHVFIGPPISALPFVMAIVLAAGVGGVNPGLFATVVGFLVVFFNIRTRDLESYPLSRGILTLVFFALLGVMISVLCELLYRYRREALRQARFCEEAHDAIFAWQLEGPVLYWNRGADELYGFDRAAAFSATTHPLLGAKNRAVFEDVKATLLRTGQWLGELSHHTSDGREVRVESRMRLITDGTERIVVEADRDVTERMHTLTALREADRRKDEFLATLAHEIRNPLAPIRNELEIMRVARGNADVIERSRAVMERQLAHLVHLVDDLMDVSRITRGKLELRREKLSLDAALQAALETSRPLIEAAHHNLVLNLPHEPLYVLGDLTRLAQIFSNLLNNAAKYTPPGGRITLSARRVDHEAVIEVRDSGVGIAADALPDIFEMFAQANRARGLTHGGLGIGLALVHGLTGDARRDGACGKRRCGSRQRVHRAPAGTGSGATRNPKRCAGGCKSRRGTAPGAGCG